MPERPEDCVSIGMAYDPESAICKDCATRLGAKFRQCYDLKQTRVRAGRRRMSEGAIKGAMMRRRRRT